MTEILIICGKVNHTCIENERLKTDYSTQFNDSKVYAHHYYGDCETIDWMAIVLQQGNRFDINHWLKIVMGSR